MKLNGVEINTHKVQVKQSFCGFAVTCGENGEVPIYWYLSSEMAHAVAKTLEEFQDVGPNINFLLERIEAEARHKIARRQAADRKRVESVRIAL